MVFRSLSGRLLILTILFVMLAEVLIFVPSVARFRQDHLLLRLERAQIASLTLLAQDMIAPELEAELLENAGVYNVVLHRDDMRQLILSSPVPGMVGQTFDLRGAKAIPLIRDAMARLLNPEPELIRVIGMPLREAGLEIEITLSTEDLRAEMLDYGRNIFLLSLAISVFTSTLIFFALRGTVVNPMRRVVHTMKSYAEAPEDVTRVIEPRSPVTELREAEEALASLQTELTQSLKQKERLAQLGAAVAKISHDLRNMLTVAQLFADRMETSDDPAVKRAAPKLLNSISRAVNLCEGALAFGKAEEPAPQMTQVNLGALINEVLESETLAHEQSESGSEITFERVLSGNVTLRADPEQLYRVLSNLVRNARQAIEATGQVGKITIAADDTGTEWRIDIHDTGPGLPPKAIEHLFTPFQGGTRKGGTGLGLAISAELIRGHGGRLEMKTSDQSGTHFVILLPKQLQ